jgi:hypothetical protein
MLVSDSKPGTTELLLTTGANRVLKFSAQTEYDRA